MIQGGVGLRGPTTVLQGGVIEVDVGPNDGSVEISAPGSGLPTRHPVTPGKKAYLPVPLVPNGTMLMVSVGDKLRARVMLVEVISLQ